MSKENTELKLLRDALKSSDALIDFYRDRLHECGERNDALKIFVSQSDLLVDKLSAENREKTHTIKVMRATIDETGQQLRELQDAAKGAARAASPAPMMTLTQGSDLQTMSDAMLLAEIEARIRARANLAEDKSQSIGNKDLHDDV